MTIIIDFDTNDWMPSLEAALGNLVPHDLKTVIVATDFNFQEDALATLEAAKDIELVIDATLEWVKANHVRVYHGTRLTDDEVTLLHQTGMQPLLLYKRVEWLRAAVPELADVLTDEVVDSAVAEGFLAYRENQIHAAISLKLLEVGYDYMLKGSEFDRRLLEHAGRDDLVPILTSRGKARLVKIVITGQEALDAMHPIFTVEDVRRTDRFPNFVRELLTEFLWALRYPERERHGVDACLMFKRPIPGHQIEHVALIERSADAA
ncbi:hypothetical protein [Neorhizobium sp. T25_27]|uniref:hypothetical protein n=1 Tax=Neorhizobium sp. T25_27 TaxID=2093831 RepID=UPI00155E613B|nr:hypothetical protein [Neorhizobium sp. T25_27]